MWQSIRIFICIDTYMFFVVVVERNGARRGMKRVMYLLVAYQLVYSHARAVLCCVLLCWVVLCCAVPCCAVMCRAVHDCGQVSGSVHICAYTYIYIIAPGPP